MKAHYKSVMRAYRLAFKTDIMSANGFAIRMQATSQVRAFTGVWDIPIRSNESPWIRRKTDYKPNLAFRRFIAAN
jgi:hypothetical protein